MVQAWLFLGAVPKGPVSLDHDVMHGAGAGWTCPGHLQTHSGPLDKSAESSLLERQRKQALRAPPRPEHRACRTLPHTLWAAPRPGGSPELPSPGMRPLQGICAVREVPCAPGRLTGPPRSSGLCAHAHPFLPRAHLGRDHSSICSPGLAFQM